MKRKTAQPTLKVIAAAIGLSVRRTSELKRLGMPCHSTSAALEWYRARNGGSTAEELRRERIGLVRAQRERQEVENRRAAGELVTAASAMESATAVCAVTRSALMKLTSDLPPMLAGLTEPKIARVLRVEFCRILGDMADGRFFDTPEVAAIIASAKREANSR